MKLGKDSFILLLLLFLGATLAIVIFSVSPKTILVSKAELPVVNLNTASTITTTANPDGTMGPAAWAGNFSKSLPASQKGKLAFYVTDPPGKPTDVPKGGNKPTVAVSTQGKGSEQTVTSLVLNITKVEVHLAYLGTPTANSGKAVDHWETLNIGGPKVVDLVQLAQSGSVSLLGITDLAAGRYTEIRLYLTSATATLEGGSTVNLTILGQDKIVRVVRTFTIVAGQTTSLTLDFDAQNSAVKAGDKYLLKPVVGKILVNLP